MTISNTSVGCGQDGGISPEQLAVPGNSADDPAGRPAVVLLPGRHRRAEGGHPWIYSNEVRMDAVAKALAPQNIL